MIIVLYELAAIIQLEFKNMDCFTQIILSPTAGIKAAMGMKAGARGAYRA